MKRCSTWNNLTKATAKRPKYKTKKNGTYLLLLHCYILTIFYLLETESESQHDSLCKEHHYFRGRHRCIKSSATSISMLYEIPAEPWTSSDVLILEFRYHHRAGSRKLAVMHAKNKQLTTAQDKKGYKIKTPHVSKTAWSWFLAWKTVSSESIMSLFLPDICDEVTSQPEQGGRFALISLSDFLPQKMDF